MDDAKLREKAMMAVVAVVVLYAVAVGVWFFSAESAWKRAAKAYGRERDRYEQEEKLISEKRKWNELYDLEKAAMPTFEAGKATDTVWLRKVENLARTNLVLITSIDSGKEVEAGDVLELPIEVKSWEGSLEALVKFMHELENTDQGMFDIKVLNFKPSSKKGYLRGSFTLTCAYMRE